ncbi:MAG: PQQ-binding-like beta-propeller repeat protein [Lachnospiraceae bacterium]|nr:PQQ-binding-like beta-propeller repeat protein [Lachnospiraceae bacterium]
MAVLGFFFALLIKVKGNLSYVYNFFVKTRGALQTAYNASAAEGADAAVPYATEQTDPGKWFLGTTISVNGEEVAEYNRDEAIRFTEEYLDHFPSHEGIITYRGSYRRDVTSYGTPALAENRFGATWRYKTGRFLKCDGVNYWSGNGWTGQPLAVRWDGEMKQHMNLYPEAKQKDGLVEIIYPGMDGKIHFLDMETGEETRPAINVGMCFKGTCSLHPEYPLLVCGSGDSATGPFGEQVSARIFIYNLIDGTKLYEFAADDPFAPRLWHGFDSSPIYSVATDTVICAGENGVLYTVHLNSSYDAATGTLTIDPDEVVRYKYESKSAEERFESSELSNGSGSESSAVVWEQYLFFGDNGGIFQCLDLNTMQPVWVQDLREDINSSPVLEVTERGEVFLYVATTLKYYYDKHHLGTAVLYKLNAKTGEVVWQKAYEVHTVLGLAGGFLSSGASGEGKVSDYIYYAVSKVPEVDTSYIIAINKQTGEEIWQKELSCDAWSSPALIYAADGSVKLCQCCGNGDILLMDAETGKVLDKVNFGSNIESTPVIFENHLAVGLRSEYIAGVELR